MILMAKPKKSVFISGIDTLTKKDKVRVKKLGTKLRKDKVKVTMR